MIHVAPRNPNPSSMALLYVENKLTIVLLNERMNEEKVSWIFALGGKLVSNNPVKRVTYIRISNSRLIIYCEHVSRRGEMSTKFTKADKFPFPLLFLFVGAWSNVCRVASSHVDHVSRWKGFQHSDEHTTEGQVRSVC